MGVALLIRSTALPPRAPRLARPAHRRLNALAVSLALSSILSCAPLPKDVPAGPPPAAEGAGPFGMAGPLPLRFEFEGVLGGYGSGPGQMAYPEGVAVDDLARVFVADTGNNRVLRFDQAGVFLGEFGGFGFDEGRFDKPRDLVVGRGLSLWVLDGENARVVRYDLDGRLVGTALDFSSPEARGMLGRVVPGGLAGEPVGRLYVTDTEADRLIAVNALGGGASVIGGFGSQPGRFRHPTGVAVDGRGTVLVADGGNGRVQALDSFGRFLRAWPLSGEQRDGRVALCWLERGRLAIAERDSSRISVVSGDGRLLARLDARGSGPGRIDRPSALAADRLGRLYVADTGNHRVQVFRLAESRAAAPR